MNAGHALGIMSIAIGVSVTSCGGAAQAPAGKIVSGVGAASRAPVSSASSPSASSSSVSSSGSASTEPKVSVKPLSQTALRYALPTVSGLQVLPTLALEAGYFKDEGLDVAITTVSGPAQNLAAMTAGDVNMSNSDSPSTLQGHMNGVPTVLLAVPVNKPIFDFMVGPDIKQTGDLKGKTIGVNTVGDSTYFQVTMALESWNLKVQQDVKVIPLGGSYPSILAAIKSGQIAAGPLPPPFNFQAKREGFHPLADLSKLPIDFPTAVVQSTDKFTKEHPDTVIAFLRAYVKAIYRYKSDEAFAVNVYRKFLKSDDTVLLQDTWGYYKDLMLDDPSPTKEGVQFVLRNLADQGNANAKTADPASFFDPSFVQKLKAEGTVKTKS